MLSILIPAFNAALYLENAVESIINEAVELEIVICNDGSTDNTLEIALMLARKHACIRVISQENRGAAAARNLAYNICNGDWVIYFDADDLYVEGSLVALYRAACQAPYSIIYCSWSKFVLGEVRSVASTWDFIQVKSGSEWLINSFLYDYPTYTGTFLLPRTVIDSVGGWNESLGFQDDMEFFSRALVATKYVFFCPEAHFLYRADVANSLSKSFGVKASESHLKATELAIKVLLSVDHSRLATRAAFRQLKLVSYAQYFIAPIVSHRAGLLAQGLVIGRHTVWLPGGKARKILQFFLGWKGALHLHRRLKSFFS